MPSTAHVNLKQVTKEDIDRHRTMSGGWTPIEPGDYIVSISDTTLKDAKSGKGEVLSYKCTVLAGPNKGRTFLDNLNLTHENPVAAGIGAAKYKMLGIACKVRNPDSIKMSEELHAKPFHAKVGEKVNKATGAVGNEIQDAWPREAAKVAPAPEPEGDDIVLDEEVF